MVPKFDGAHGQDISKWINDLEHTFQIFRYNGRDKLVAARHLLQGHAKKFVEILSITSYDELKAALVTEFGRTFTMQDVFKMLKARTIKPGETVRQYIVEMQCIASRAVVPEADLLDFIIEGINDPTPNGAMLYSATTLAELKILLDRYERKRSLATRTRSANQGNFSFTPRQNSIDMATVRCYNCFRYGHFQGTCTAPKRDPMACFNCNKVGHQKHQCPQRGRQNATATITAAIAHMDEDKLNQLAEQLASKNLVSIAFYKQGGCIGDLYISALFDSGSPISFVCRSCIPFEVAEDCYLTSYRGVGNKRVRTYGMVVCKIKFKQQEEFHKFYVLPDEDAVVPVLIGRDLLKKFKIFLYKINTTQTCKYKPDELKRLNELKNRAELSNEVKNALASFELKRNSTRVKPKKEENLMCENMVEDSDNGSKEAQSKESSTAANNIIEIGKQLSQTEANKIKEIIQDEYLKVFDKKKKFKECSMKIRLTEETPIFSGPRRLSVKEKLEVQQTIDELLEEGIIRPSESPYASPIVLVRKKDGNLRMCVDYRAVNKVIVRDRYPLPLMEDCLAAMGGKSVFSLLDLKNGFHQVPVEEESKHITAFVTPMGQYEYNYVPFGIVNSPPVFQRFIGRVLEKVIAKGKVIVYLDDICVATETMEEHYKILSEVLKLLVEAGLELNLKKCKFGYDVIKYLGYNVSKKGMSLCEEHITSIKNCRMPTNAKEVQRCLGLFSYFRRFVRNFSKIARPLSKLLGKEVTFEWTEEQIKAFEELKQALIEAPVLCMFDPAKETELHTDASSKGYGAVLMQKQEDGRLHPIAYYSRATTDAESRYHSFELETLAIVNALERFRVYLDGIPFVIVTDCNSLILTLEKKVINPRIARWTLGFADFNFKVKHRGGDQMLHVDALSRAPLVGLVDEGTVDVNIQIVQSRDQVIKELTRKLEEERVSGYRLENGLVFRENESRLQLYVPKEMEENVMRMVHENYGHFGIEKCAAQIQKHYWFPKMREKLAKFIQNCLKCIFYSNSSKGVERNLYSIPKKPEPWDTIHIDHFGPLEGVQSQRKHILVIVDAFTKFVKLYAVNTSTKESTCALQKYFLDYSRPRRIISDRGTCFTSMEFKTFCSERNIEHILNAVASPQSNGQVERVNRVLKAILSKITEPIEHADWKKKLIDVEFAINNSVSSSTKQTPSKLLFGVEQRGRIVEELTEYLQEKYGEVTEGLSEIREQASEAIKKSQEYNQNYFTSHHRPAQKFLEGDLVVIKNVDTTVGKNKKLIPKYKGPYIIRKVLEHDRYIVTDTDNCQISQMPYKGVIDSSRMRLWLDQKELQNDNSEIEGNTIDNSSNEENNNDDDTCTEYEYLDEDIDYGTLITLIAGNEFELENTIGSMVWSGWPNVIK